MPLSRELCEALAEALPEVRGHRFAVGDHVWPPRHARRTGVGVLVQADAVAAINEEASGALWCPSLADLLAIAQRHECFGWLACGRSLCGDRSQPWECGDGDADLCGPQDCARGKTAEEAVARWLMAYAPRGAHESTEVAWLAAAADSQRRKDRPQ